MPHVKLMTNSRLKCARACLRRHFYFYELGRRPVGGDADDALVFGTAVHKALEVWWRERRMPPVQMSDPYRKVVADELLLGYALRWKDQDLETLAAEVEFKAGFGAPGWELAGKIDAVARERNRDQVVTVEHKTSGEEVAPGSRYWMRLRLDTQVTFYEVGAHTLDWPVDHCLYDVLGKPKLEPYRKSAKLRHRKDGEPYANQRTDDEPVEEYAARVREAISASPESFYQRADVVRLAGEREECIEEARDWALIIDANSGPIPPPRNPDSCFQYGKLCPYYGVCTGMESIEDERKFKTVERLHPELDKE